MVAGVVRKVIEQGTERTETRPVVAVGTGNGHQTAQSKTREAVDMGHECRQVRRRDAGLLWLGIDVDLDADIEGAFGCGIESAGDPRAVHGVDPLETAGDVAGLVRLDGTDEVPDDVEVRQGLRFRNGFLEVVLAEIALTGVKGGPNLGGGSGL